MVVFWVLDVSHAADAANIFWTASVAVTHAEDMFEFKLISVTVLLIFLVQFLIS